MISEARESPYRQDEWMVLIAPGACLLLVCSECGARFWLCPRYSHNACELYDIAAHRELCGK